MARSGSNCTSLDGSFLSTLGGDEGRPNRLPAISFGIRVPVRKKGQRPVFRGIKRKKALCEANKPFPVRRHVPPLVPHLRLSRRRKILGNKYEEEEELEGREKMQAATNGSVTNRQGDSPLSIQSTDPALQCNPRERSSSCTGSECSQILRVLEDNLQDSRPPSFAISPLPSPNPKVEMSPRKNLSNKRVLVLELYKDWWTAHRSTKTIGTKRKGDGDCLQECPICKVKHHYCRKARQLFLDIDMVYLFKNLHRDHCEDGSVLIEIRDCRFNQKPEPKDYKLQLGLGSILHEMRLYLVAAKAERLKKKTRKSQQQQQQNNKQRQLSHKADIVGGILPGYNNYVPRKNNTVHDAITRCPMDVTTKQPHEANNTTLQMWPKLAKSEAAALVALVPPSDLNLAPELVSPVTEDYFGPLSARRLWHYHYLGQNLIFQGDNATIDPGFGEKEEAEWADEQTQLLKGFIDLNHSSSNSTGSCDSLRNENNFIVAGDESTLEKQPLVEDMRKKMKPYGRLTALRCQAHLLKDNRVEELKTSTTMSVNTADHISCSPQNGGAGQPSPRSTTLSPMPSPRRRTTSMSEFSRLLLHGDESFAFKQPSFVYNPNEGQKLRNGGLLWPIGTFVMAAKVFNEKSKAKTADSMNILYVREMDKGVMDNAWSERAHSFSMPHTPIAVIDKLVYARASMGLHSSPMEEMAGSQTMDAITEGSPAFVPSEVTDPDNYVLKSIVTDFMACKK